VTSKEKGARRSWRDVLDIHPAAELLPSMTTDDLKQLSADIDAEGLRDAIAFTPDGKLLDGRGRLDGMELADIPTVTAKGALSARITRETIEGDPWAYVMSKNVRRRHLTSAQKRKVIEALLKANPERSNRETAKLAGASDKTAGKVRQELEETAEIPQLETTTGADNKRRPSRRTGVQPFAAEKTPADDLHRRAKAAAAKVKVGERVRALIEAGNRAGEVAHRVTQDIPGVTMTRADVRALALPPRLVEAVARLVEAVGGAERAQGEIEGLTVELAERSRQPVGTLH